VVDLWYKKYLKPWSFIIQEVYIHISGQEFKCFTREPGPVTYLYLPGIIFMTKSEKYMSIIFKLKSIKFSRYWPILTAYRICPSFMLVKHISNDPLLSMVLLSLHHLSHPLKWFLLLSLFLSNLFNHGLYIKCVGMSTRLFLNSEMIFIFLL
jgi:hypothetical protein